MNTKEEGINMTPNKPESPAVTQMRQVLGLKEKPDKKLEMLNNIMQQRAQEAFATGKATAYREMIYLVRDLAGQQNAKNPTGENPGDAVEPEP